MLSNKHHKLSRKKATLQSLVYMLNTKTRTKNHKTWRVDRFILHRCHPYQIPQSHKSFCLVQFCTKELSEGDEGKHIHGHLMLLHFLQLLLNQENANHLDSIHSNFHPKQTGKPNSVTIFLLRTTHNEIRQGTIVILPLTLKLNKKIPGKEISWITCLIWNQFQPLYRLVICHLWDL